MRWASDEWSGASRLHGRLMGEWGHPARPRMTWPECIAGDPSTTTNMYELTILRGLTTRAVAKKLYVSQSYVMRQLKLEREYRKVA